MRFETKVIHAGVEPDPLTGAVMTPIYQTSTYAQSSPGQHKGYEYSRTDNPTRTALQTQLAALEEGDDAMAFASGLAATDAVLNLLQTGDHVVASDDMYGGTGRLFNEVASKRGLTFAFGDFSNPQVVSDIIKPGTKLVWIETPTNPLLKIIDLRAVAKAARSAGALLAVDNTFATPYFQRPLTLGADIVMHSVTKYLNGHSDVVMGALAVRDVAWLDRGPSIRERLRYLQNAIGAIPSPHDCFLTLRGVKTLALRMQRHFESGIEVANFLKNHSKVERIAHPWLSCHPGHELAKSQSSGHSGMMTFWIKGGLNPARNFLENLKLFALAESLGGVESLIEHPAIMTHASVKPEVREELGISDGMIRVSVGIEAVEDLIEDLDQALARA